MEKAILLFVILNFCHFLGDYPPLSIPFINAKKFGKPIFPIFAHGGVHATLMFVPLWIFSPSILFAALLALFQQVIHTIIDTLKGRVAKWIPITADNTNKWHWIVFGLDQLLHQSTIALMIYILLK